MVEQTPPLPALEELKQYPHWIVRNAEKEPFNPRTLGGAMAGVSGTWGNYEQAHAVWKRNLDRFVGLGFELDKELGIIPVDLDHCIDENGEIDAWAQEFILLLNSYAEFSPNDGIHVWVRGELPAKRHKFAIAGQRHEKAAVEVYAEGRYMTVTGRQVPGTSTTIESRQDQLNELYRRLMPVPTPPNTSTSRPPLMLVLSDEELLDRAHSARNGQKFADLWAGSWSGYTSQSEADQALCNYLAFWTGKDAARMDRLFRQSGLYREDKWDRSARSGETYGEGTIARAIENCTEVYCSKWQEDEVWQQEGRKKETQARSVEPTGSYLEPKPVSRRRVLECMDENEYGDALLFAEAFQGLVCYDHTGKEWYLWQGQHWKVDTTDQVRLLVAGVLGSIYLKACAELNTDQVQVQQQLDRLLLQDGASETAEALKDEYKQLSSQMAELRRRARDLRATKRNTGVRAFVASIMGITSAMWDTHPWLLAVPNGVIDLRSGELRDGRPEDYIRTVCPTTWTGIDTPCPRFERFLQEIFADKPDATSIISFLHRLLGYGIAGVVEDAIFPILYGEEGRNGKDTLMGVLKSTLGPLVGAISNDVFIAQDKNRSGGAATPHLVDLQGKRLVWGSETKQGDKLNIAQIKHLTGGGDVPARQLYGKQYAFAPTHKLLLMTNFKPHADANDKAFWTRGCLIEFGIRFVSNPQTANERQADPELKEALRQETSGILAWLVRGCLTWQQKGLAIPETIQLATERYRDEEDALLFFFQECCLVRADTVAKAQVLYKKYAEWCKENQLSAMNGKLFGELMSKKYEKKHRRDGWIYQGIGILDLSSEDESVTGGDGTRHGDKPAPEANPQENKQVSVTGVTGFSTKSSSTYTDPLSIGVFLEKPVTPVTESVKNGHKPAPEAGSGPVTDPSRTRHAQAMRSFTI